MLITTIGSSSHYWKGAYISGELVSPNGSVLVEDIAAKPLSGTTAPASSTQAYYIGQMYIDTTNENAYICVGITAQGTTPETYTYTWKQITLT